MQNSRHLGGITLVNLIRCFGVKYRRIYLRVVLYFDEPEGLVKVQTTSTI